MIFTIQSIELHICVNEFACDYGYFWMDLGGLQEKSVFS
jgi:hypothetical protein